MRSKHALRETFKNKIQSGSGFEPADYIEGRRIRNDTYIRYVRADAYTGRTLGRLRELYRQGIFVPCLGILPCIETRSTARIGYTPSLIVVPD